MKRNSTNSIESVFENVEISSNVYRLIIEGEFNAIPGQFYMLRAWGDAPMLSRPISISSIEDGRLSFIYQSIGKGTKIFSKLKKNDKIEITGPLGNGFDTDNITGKVAVVSGGIGIAPMLYLVQRLVNCEIDLYAGYRDQSYMIDNFKELVKNIEISTESGQEGHKGYITEVFKPELYDTVVCCGPEPMMTAVVKKCIDKKVKVFASMEKHMACGIGACLVCTCKTKNGNKRACKDGPVFLGEQLLLI